ncbi:MAG: hypothetical protein GF350_11120 [Chitinivibrionales bacterium]|nr:hypothetical protein [Chitinivibrionales bacterium]
MNSRHILVFVIVVAMIAVQGCGKKEKDMEENNEFAAPQVEQQAEDADIFDEFYDETKTDDAAETEETFSTTSQSAEYSDVRFSESGRYVVQVSCVASPALADNLAGKLTDRGFPAYTAEVSNPTPELTGTYYRVRVGGFDGVSQAKSFGENKLAPLGYNYWVDNRSNDNIGMEGYGLGSGQSSGTYEDYSSGYSSTPEATSGDSWETTPAPEPEPEPEPEPPATTPAAEASAGDEWDTETTAETGPVSEPQPQQATPAADPEPEPQTRTTPEQAPAAEEETPAESSTSEEDDWGESDWGGDSDWGSESSDSDW